MLEKKIRMGELYDFYGQLLTDKQQEYMELYYRHDLSLAEIAVKFDISRQAVYDNLRRSEDLLEEYETKLSLLQKNKDMRKDIKRVKDIVKNIDCTQQKREQVIQIIDGLLDG